MNPKYPVILAVIALTAGIVTGCGPRPPIPYQQLQVQDTEESQGYDVYLYVAVRPGLTESQVEGLLVWFRDVKYPAADKMRVFVWDNPQAALLSTMGDLVGSLTVDREQGIDKIDINVRTR